MEINIPVSQLIYSILCENKTNNIAILIICLTRFTLLRHGMGCVVSYTIQLPQGSRIDYIHSFRNRLSSLLIFLTMCVIINQTTHTHTHNSIIEFSEFVPVAEILVRCGVPNHIYIHICHRRIIRHIDMQKKNRLHLVHRCPHFDTVVKHTLNQNLPKNNSHRRISVETFF